jgi:hypothetical protein
LAGIDASSSSDASVRLSTDRDPGAFTPVPSGCSISVASPIGFLRRDRCSRGRIDTTRRIRCLGGASQPAGASCSANHLVRTTRYGLAHCVNSR